MIRFINKDYWGLSSFLNSIEDSGGGREGIARADKKADAALVIEGRRKNHQRLAPVAAVRRGEDLRLPACLHELEMDRQRDLA